MPKVSIDYSKCCIYKIEHIENESLLYVGFTTNFNQRKHQHNTIYDNSKDNASNRNLYQMMRDNGGWENFKVIEIEKYPCSDRRGAEKRETEIMKDLKANMNMIVSFVGGGKKERDKNYRDTHKDKIKESDKIYRETHKEEIKQRKKEFYE